MILSLADSPPEQHDAIAEALGFARKEETEPLEVDGIVIHDSMSVGDLIAQLQRYDSRQRFLVQAILPDGTAWNAPAKVFEIPGSNCVDGLKYLGLQIRCELSSRGVPNVN